MARGDFDLSGTLAPLLIRVPLGIIFMAHGSQKLFGIFGGHGLTATFRSFEDKLGIPPIFTLLAIIAEFCGGLGVLTGCLTRISASGIAAVMAVAIYKVHWAHGFFMSTSSGNHGIEYNLALLGMALYLMLSGGGSWCIDRLIFRR